MKIELPTQPPKTPSRTPMILLSPIYLGGVFFYVILFQAEIMV